MQSFLKYTLLLLAFIGFTSSVFELDKDEYKHNFKKEEQTYNVSLKSETAQDFKIAPSDVLHLNFHSFLVEKKFVQLTPLINRFTDPDPPQRLYIRFSVFRI